MKLKTDSFAFRFFAINLFFPLAVHILSGLLAIFDINIQHLFSLILVVLLINAVNLTMAVFYKGWPRTGLLTITGFNIISVFAMGALSFFTSLFGWVELVPDLVQFLYPH